VEVIHMHSAQCRTTVNHFSPPLKDATVQAILYSNAQRVLFG
jgi:hypothetical protein